jgi:hypothetical protein
MWTPALFNLSLLFLSSAKQKKCDKSFLFLSSIILSLQFHAYQTKAKCLRKNVTVDDPIPEPTSCSPLLGDCEIENEDRNKNEDSENNDDG